VSFHPRPEQGQQFVAHRRIGGFGDTILQLVRIGDEIVEFIEVEAVEDIFVP